MSQSLRKRTSATTRPVSVLSAPVIPIFLLQGCKSSHRNASRNLRTGASFNAPRSMMDILKDSKQDDHVTEEQPEHIEPAEHNENVGSDLALLQKQSMQVSTTFKTLETRVDKLEERLNNVIQVVAATGAIVGAVRDIIILDAIEKDPRLLNGSVSHLSGMLVTNTFKVIQKFLSCTGALIAWMAVNSSFILNIVFIAVILFTVFQAYSFLISILRLILDENGTRIFTLDLPSIVEILNYVLGALSDVLGTLCSIGGDAKDFFEDASDWVTDLF